MGRSEVRLGQLIETEGRALGSFSLGGLGVDENGNFLVGASAENLGKLLVGNIEQ